MAIKIGNRVTVLPGVSNCRDLGSIQKHGSDGVSRDHFVGKRGEVVEIREDGCVLVDDQIVNGKPIGHCNMREWFKPEELEVG